MLDDALAGAQGRLSLDAFASNHVVCEWYRRKGFLDQFERVVQVVDLHHVPPARLGVAGATDVAAQARQSELEQGFGEFTIEAGSSAYRFGLVGESTVRLLEYASGEATVAASIARAVVPDREHFALPIGEACNALPTFFTDRLIRMELVM